MRSHEDGVCFDRIEPVYRRYAKAGTGRMIEMWTIAHQLPRIPRGKTLCIITESEAAIRWSIDGWKTTDDLVTRDAGLGCWFGDLPSEELPEGTRIEFTFRWRDGWQGVTFQVDVTASN